MPCNSTYEFRQLRVNELNPNGYNPNRMSPGQFSALKRTIQKDGFVGVILVRPLEAGYSIIDGEHRWKAAMELGVVKIPCAIICVTEKQARSLMIKLNQIHGDWIPDLLMDVVCDLCEPATDLGFAEGEIEALLKQFREIEVFQEMSANETNFNRPEPGERYVGFNLTSARRKLLDDALELASTSNRDLENSRAGSLEVILRAFLNHAR